MTATTVRRATMDDTHAISALFRARVEVWQRLDAEGRVEEVPYDALTIYERWLHGSGFRNAWMSVETAAILLSYLIQQGCTALVAEQNGVVVGYAEAYPGDEPAPFKGTLHILHLLAPDDAVQNVLLNALKQEAGKRRLSVSLSGYDHAAAQNYGRNGFQKLLQVEQYTLVAQSGRSFYQATEHRNANPSQIVGWSMPIGRTESAATHWHLLWPGLWDSLEPVAARRTHRLAISAAGQEAFVCVQAQLYMGRTADVYCWSPKPLTSQLLVSLRDWAYREGYRTLVFAVPPETARLFGSDAETQPYKFDIYTTS